MRLSPCSLPPPAVIVARRSVSSSHFSLFLFLTAKRRNIYLKKRITEEKKVCMCVSPSSVARLDPGKVTRYIKRAFATTFLRYQSTHTHTLFSRLRERCIKKILRTSIMDLPLLSEEAARSIPLSHVVTIDPFGGIDLMSCVYLYIF